MVILSGLKALSLNIENSAGNTKNHIYSVNNEELKFKKKRQNKQNKTCVIFGGSFNPPHVGHQIILSYAMDLFEADFFILPTKQPPHKDIEVNFQKRFRWSEISFMDFQGPNIFLWDLENHIDGVNYAIRNVEEFIPYYDRIIFLVGEDALGNIEKWYQYQKLFEYAYFAVYPRTKDRSLYKRGKEVLGNLYSKVLELHDFPIVEISSTDIRRRVLENKSVIGMVDIRIIEDVIESFTHLKKQK